MLETLGIVVGTILSIFIFVGLFCIFEKPAERKSDERKRYYKKKYPKNLINVKDQKLKQNDKNYCNKSIVRNQDIGK